MSYAYDTIADIIRLAEENNISFGDVVLRYELENHTFSSSSSMAICRLMGGCATCSLRAALEMLLASATATKYSNCLKFIPSYLFCISII